MHKQKTCENECIVSTHKYTLLQMDLNCLFWAFLIPAGVMLALRRRRAICEVVSQPTLTKDLTKVSLKVQ